MKFIFVIGDGMADEPIPELGGKTPLEAANIENMDHLVKNGIIGLCRSIPEEITPGSDIANMNLLGYDPSKYYTGRGPLEAEGMGIKVKNNEYVFRCNLVSIQDWLMKDFTAGHISTLEAKHIIESLNSELSNEKLHFYTGINYRHILTIKGNFSDLRCTPPHDIIDKHIYQYLPEGNEERIIRKLIFKSAEIIKKNPVNLKRIKKGKLPVSHIWLWGGRHQTRTAGIQ